MIHYLYLKKEILRQMNGGRNLDVYRFSCISAHLAFLEYPELRETTC